MAFAASPLVAFAVFPSARFCEKAVMAVVKATIKNRNFFMFLRAFAVTIIVLGSAAIITMLTLSRSSQQTISQYGSRGKEVRAIQQELKDRGLFHDDVTGYYGPVTQAAVKRFQKQQGISQTGIAGPATLKALGITVGSIPAATQANISLLARIISAEARGEPYEGQVAVGAVVLNRVKHPSFPNTLAGVIYQPGAFTAVDDGQINAQLHTTVYAAARDALNGWDPSGGAIYYYNPRTAKSAWIRTRPVICTIGNHVFCS